MKRVIEYILTFYGFFVYNAQRLNYLAKSNYKTYLLKKYNSKLKSVGGGD